MIMDFVDGGPYKIVSHGQLFPQFDRLPFRTTTGRVISPRPATAARPTL